MIYQKSKLKFKFIFIFCFFVFSISKKAQGSNVGVYTGTFDPPHNGHIELVKKSIKLLNLDKIFIIPNVESGHKSKTSPYIYRKAMTEIAFKNIPQALISDREIEKAFIDSDVDGVIKHISTLYPKTQQIALIMGIDSFLRFKDVKGKIPFPNLTVYVSRRAGETLKSLPEQTDNIRTQWLEDSAETTNYSSTKTRKAIQEGKVPKNLPPEIFNFIQKYQLYNDTPRPCSLSVIENLPPF